MKKLTKAIAIILTLSLAITGFVFTTTAAENEDCTHNWMKVTGTRTTKENPNPAMYCHVEHLTETKQCTICKESRVDQWDEYFYHNWETAVGPNGDLYTYCVNCSYRVN